MLFRQRISILSFPIFVLFQALLCIGDGSVVSGKTAKTATTATSISRIRRKEMIVGGEEVQVGRYGWMVACKYRDEEVSCDEMAFTSSNF